MTNPHQLFANSPNLIFSQLGFLQEQFKQLHLISFFTRHKDYNNYDIL